MTMTLTISLGILTFIELVVLGSLLIDLVNYNHNRSDKLGNVMYNKLKMLLTLTVVLMLCVPARKYYALMDTVRDTQKLHGMVIEMYSNDPADVQEKIEPYRHLFTDKGFMGVDAGDNVFNILDRYTKYSKATNKVEIVDSFPTHNKIYILFTITGEEGGVQHRTAVMHKGLTRIDYYEEYIRIPER